MMSTLFTGRSVWLYHQPVDFRKQINGLIGVVESEMASRVEDGSIYVFLNRSRRQAKLLLWHHNGYFMGVKRRESGRFDEPIDIDHDGCGL